MTTDGSGGFDHSYSSIHVLFLLGNCRPPNYGNREQYHHLLVHFDNPDRGYGMLLIFSAFTPLAW